MSIREGVNLKKKIKVGNFPKGGRGGQAIFPTFLFF